MRLAIFSLLIFSLLLFSLLLFSSYAFSNDCLPREYKLSIYYSNGMFNDISDSIIGLKNLENKVRFELKDYNTKYEISYNQSEAWYSQLIEVFSQKFTDSWSFFLLYISGDEPAPNWFQDALRNTVIERHGDTNDEDLQNHVTEYRSAIEACSRVMIVAHSQGNFYANGAWSEIYRTRSASGKYEMQNFLSLGLLSVATPTSYVGNWVRIPDDHEPITDYYTLTNDRVMVFVRTFFPTTLLGNITNNNDDLDFWHHNFVESYLNGSRSGLAIVDAIKRIVSQLEPLPLARNLVDSSSIISIGYLENSEILEVEFVSNGSVYRYYDVPKVMYENLLVAESIGNYFYHNIRNEYTYKKVF